MSAQLTRWDRFLMALAPQWALNRIRARTTAMLIARHYEAASAGRRTDAWNRSTADANTANGPDLGKLRFLARDILRNNSWARRGHRVIGNNTVGWGLMPNPKGTNADRAAEIWAAWAEKTECDAEGQRTFYGIQRQAMDAIVEGGEVLIRRRWRRPGDGLTLPLQLQVLESDFIDTNKDGVMGTEGGPIIHGIEFNAIGRRVAYWLFEAHPGATRLRNSFVSKRVPADDIAHVFRAERAGQVRGVSWFAPTIVKLKDFDEYDDATLMRQKIAACFAAFVTDADGIGGHIGQEDEEDDTIESLEPGLISQLPPGKQISFANPPVVSDHESFSKTNLRAVAAGLGVTYEDLTGDYSQVNFSSARMARLAHWANVHDWRWNMLVPQLCDRVWSWAMAAAVIAGEIEEAPGIEWTDPPMPMIEPDKEGIAFKRLVRAGAMTPSEMVRQQGRDPKTHFAEYAADLAMLDEMKIVLDSDPRRTSDAGLTQERVKKGSNSGAEQAEAAE